MGIRFVLLIWLLVLVDVILKVLALWRLRHLKIDDVAKALWGLTILLVPIGGPVASFLVLLRTPEDR